MAKVRERKWSKMMRPELGKVYFGGYPSLKGKGARTKGRTQAEKMGGGGEVSPLRKGQQDYIDRLRAGKGGKTDTGGGGFSQKSKSLEGQKVTKRKKKEGRTMEQDAQKQKELRDKQEKMEAEGRQHRQDQKKQRELYGDWLPTSKKAIKDRKAGKYKAGRTRRKKKKEEEKSTPYHHEGGSGK